MNEQVRDQYSDIFYSQKNTNNNSLVQTPIKRFKFSWLRDKSAERNASEG